MSPPSDFFCSLLPLWLLVSSFRQWSKRSAEAAQKNRGRDIGQSDFYTGVILANVAPSVFLQAAKLSMKSFFALAFQGPQPTHSVPSGETSFFQIGTTSFRRSMMKAHASKAAFLCGLDTQTTTATSPSVSTPWR